MSNELTIWVTPFTELKSLDEAIDTCKQLANDAKYDDADWHPNLLLPTHYGQWPQSQCKQSLPDDMRVSGPADIAPIRERVEAAGLGFGAWGVPNTAGTGAYAASFAKESGYYVTNTEPGAFWLPGDNVDAVNQWWGDFWSGLGDDADTMSGNVAATVIPNVWGLGAFTKSLGALNDGCKMLILEAYGGPSTSGSYPYPNLWPNNGWNEVEQFDMPTTLILMLARANVQAQLKTANRLSVGNVHVWCI